jgi:hypothetical protein
MTPSPGPLPLCGMEQAPVAVHPLPQGGEGKNTTTFWLRPRDPATLLTLAER